MNISAENNRLSLVYMPTHLSEALELLTKNPDALIYAGGTDILSHQTTRMPVFNRQIISLRRVEELKIMRRYENFVEIGSAVTLGEILRRKESRFLPPVLKYAVQAIGTPALRNTATVGGNLAVSDRKLLLLPVLLILDSFLEVGKSHHIDFIQQKLHELLHLTLFPRFHHLHLSLRGDELILPRSHGIFAGEIVHLQRADRCFRPDSVRNRPDRLDLQSILFDSSTSLTIPIGKSM